MKADDFLPYIEAVQNETGQGYDGIESKVELYETFVKYVARGANNFHLQKIAKMIVRELDLNKPLKP